jgi:hypothetical protein
MSHLYEALRRLEGHAAATEPASKTVSTHSHDFRPENPFEQPEDAGKRQDVIDKPQRPARLVRSRQLSFAELIAEIARDEEELDY